MDGRDPRLAHAQAALDEAKSAFESALRTWANTPPADVDARDAAWNGVEEKRAALQRAVEEWAQLLAPPH